MVLNTQAEGKLLGQRRALRGKWPGRAGRSSGHGMPCPYWESDICAQALGVGAGEAGAGAGGHAAGVALGAFVGLVAGDVHFEQGAGGDVEFDRAAAAIDERAGGYGEAAFLFDYADGFARGAACGPDIFDYRGRARRASIQSRGAEPFGRSGRVRRRERERRERARLRVR